MINYSNWPRKKISVTSLRLDTQNPRLTNQGQNITQPEIINYLIENEKAYDLAKNILSQGYFLNESPIVVVEGEKYVVLEGNRRMSACKILINPDLIASKTKRTIIKKALTDFDINNIKKIEVILAPSRKEADVMIMNRHTGGSVVEKWDVTKQDRFIYNRFKGGESISEMAAIFSMTKGDIRKSLQRYNMFIEINKLSLDEIHKKILQEETKFNMTNVERVYDSKHGRDFLGIDFNDKGGIIRKLPKEEFQKRLAAITEKVIEGEINSRTLNTESEKEKYLKKLLETGVFDENIKPDIKYNTVEVPEIEEHKEEQTSLHQSSKKSKSNDNKLFDENLKFISGNKRIDQIFAELKTLNLKTQINAAAVLMRSYIDMVTYQFLKNKGLIAEMNKADGLKLKDSNDRVLKSITEYLKEVGVKENKVDLIKLQKAARLKGSIAKDFIPSLRNMLDFIASGDVLTEVKLKQSLQSHLNKNDTLVKIIGHNEFNLLVHNEYHHTDITDLKSAWNRLEPLLEYMITPNK